MANQVLLPLLAFFPMGGALLGYLLGRKWKAAREWISILVTALTFLGSISLLGAKEETVSLSYLFSFGLTFSVSGMQVLLAILTGFVWLATTLFSKEYFKKSRNLDRYYFFMQMTLGATMGVFLSADFFTTFIFFEIMSFTSYVLVLHEGEEASLKAGQTYLGVAVIGGLVTLMGLFMMYAMAGTLEFNAVADFVAAQADKQACYAAGVLILVGFGAKAGLFPLHIWLPEVYTEAPAPASALLSCILSKTGIFGVILLSAKVFLHDAKWGELMLILGMITMVLGAVLAVFSINLKRTLACSSLSQIGFIMIGIAMQGLLGEHNALAAMGTTLHLTNHTLIKLVLFLSAGVVYMNLRQLDLNAIRGYGKDKPLLKIAFLMGLLGVAGVPLWNGYISKTLIHESIVEYIAYLEEMGMATGFYQFTEVLFLCSGGLTLAYMTKIFVAVFVEENPNAKRESKQPYMSPLSAAVLAISAVLLPIFGCLPYLTQDKIASAASSFMNAHDPAHAVEYFSWVNLKGAVISIIFGAVVYLLFVRKVLMKTDANGVRVYVDRWPKKLNLEDGLYRPLLLVWLPYIGGFFARILGSATDFVLSLLKAFVFNQDNGKVIPPEDLYFSIYTDGEKKNVYREGLARSLMMFGFGVAVALLYILF